VLGSCPRETYEPARPSRITVQPRNVFRDSFATGISNRGLVRLKASRSPCDRCRQDLLWCRRSCWFRWTGQKGTKALAGFLRQPERKTLLTVSGINVQFNSKAWLVTYDPANTEADDGVIFREVFSHENADALGSLVAVSKHRDGATMNHPPSTAFQCHLMPAAYRYLYVRIGDQPENVYGRLRTTQHCAGSHDGDATRDVAVGGGLLSAVVLSFNP
jgi:hypothetical protein